MPRLIRIDRRAFRVDLMIPLAPQPVGGDVPGAPIVPGFRELGDGSIAIPARLSRTGILEYSYDEPEGTVREYRSPEEVFDQKSIDSFKGITVCELHPDTSVDPDNWEAVSIGHIADNVRPDGIYVAADVIVKKADAIAKAKRGDLRELSAGYTCGIIEGAGTSPEGEPYDAEQVGIMANHVALGPRDWGRSGGEVRLYLDSKHGRATRVEPKRKVDQMTPEELLAKYNEASKALEEANAKIAELEAQLAEAKKAGGAGGEEPPKGDAEGEEGEEDPKGDKKVDSMIAKIDARNAVIVRVSKILNTDSIDAVGKKDRELMLQGIRHIDPKFDDKGKDNSYLRAVLDSTFAQVVKDRAANHKVLSTVTLLGPKTEGKTDSKEEDDAKAAYDKKQADRWKSKA